MFTRPFFEPDRAASLAFVEARGFGTVCAFDGGKPVASPLPFCLEYSNDGTPCVSFHVARGNPLAGLADGVSSRSSARPSSPTLMSRRIGTRRPIKYRLGCIRPCI